MITGETEKKDPGKRYLFYRILGSVDNFIAILLLFGMLMNFAALGFSTMLLFPLFISISILLYTNFAAVFVRYVMVKGNFLRYKLKEWIKVNAYVTLIFSLFVIITFSYSLFEGKALNMVSENMQVPPHTLKQLMIGFMAGMVLLFIHVIMTLRYLKQFNHHFRNPEDTGNPPV